MLKNFITVAMRNMLRYKGYSAINIAGLAIGLACSIYIGAYVVNELTFDGFHSKAKQIYRICLDGKINEQSILSPVSNAPIAPTMKVEIPGVENFCRIEGTVDMMMRYENKIFNEGGLIFTDSTFFQFFDFKLLSGDAKTVLREPHTIVLSQEMANKYFGSEDPMGKMIKSENDTILYRVTGICENVPDNSHIKFDMVASICGNESIKNDIWLGNSFAAYVMLQPNVKQADIEKKMHDLLLKYGEPQLKQILNISWNDFVKAGNHYEYFLEPLLDVHLYSKTLSGSEAKMVYIFIIIAVFILLIACINFMNLSTARAANRAKEVGIRKVLGSQRRFLMLQFLSEAFFISLLSLILAVMLLELLMPSLNSFLDIKLNINYFQNWFIIPSLLALVVIVGVLAGSYPAFVLANFQPVAVLKGKMKAGSKSSVLRKILVVFQFTISTIILLGTLVIYQQINYFLNKNLGFNKEQMLIIQRASTLGKQTQAFQDEIRKDPNIVNTSNSNTLPGYLNSNQGYQFEGVDPSKTFIFWRMEADPQYLKTMGIDLVEGRFFEEGSKADSNVVILNESATRELGFKTPKEAMGKRIIDLRPHSDHNQFLPIVGIVKDWHFQSLHSQIAPMIFHLKHPENSGVVNVRLRPENNKQTISMIEKTWKKFTNDQPFEYFFIDKKLEELYKSETQVGKISTFFAFLAIFIACLGLFGLISFTSLLRTKEIGIRKTLGASTQTIIYLLSKETIILVIVSSLIAYPVAYYYMDKWLQNFVYRMNINWLVFVLTTFLVILIALLTVSFQAIKAARRNSIEALRYE